MKLSELPMNGFAPGGPLRIGRSVQNSFELGAGRFVEVAAEPKSLIVEEGKHEPTATKWETYWGSVRAATTVLPTGE
jgi:hypothetical protein